MTDIDKEREAFEAWAKPDSVQAVRTDCGTSYRNAAMSAGWSAWQARAKQHSGEVVGYCSEESLKTAKSGRDAIFGAKTKDYRTVALYLSPQQPHSVASALEMAAQLIEQNISWSDAGDDEQTLINNVLHDAGKAIRNLINQPTQG